ncbi:ABC transporter substrate-binding protein [Chloroflexi bacterium TSY]|nr:ABC transporter substrate-binding protein [Chloroflexi bacterium TSY]
MNILYRILDRSCVKHWGVGSISQLISMFVVAAFLLTACWGSSNEGEVSVAPESQIELRIVADDVTSQIAKGIYRLFEEQHPYIKIKTEAWSNWPRVYLEQEKPPDILDIGSGDWLFSVIDDGLVADISDIWEQSTIRETYPEELHRLTEREGKQYFLPTGYAWFGIYYNREVFAQFGFSEPETWDELMEIAETLLLAGERPFAIPMGSEWAASHWFDYLNLRLNGADFHWQLINGEVSFLDERVRNVFVTWQFLFDQSYVPTGAYINSGMSSIAATIRGDRETPLTREKTAMALSGPTLFDDFPKVFLDELGFFRFPTIDPTIPASELVGVGGMVVAANAPNRLEALEYFTYILSPEVQDLVATGVSQEGGTETPFVPAHLNTDIDNLAENIQKGARIIDGAEGVALPYFWASPPEMRSKMDSALSKFLILLCIK